MLRKIKRNSFLLVLLCTVFAVNAQDASSKLYPEQFYKLVLDFHPYVQAADVEVAKGELEKQFARGYFDPVLYGDYKSKVYGDKEYYNLLGTGLKFPTWYGVELSGGYDQNAGEYLNPENTVPDEGLWYGGIEVNLGKGLITDERRIAIKKAEVYQEASVQTRIYMINQLLFEAFDAYYNWVLANQNLRIRENAIDLAEVRYENVKSSFFLGDVSAIDTVEALLSLQSRQVDYVEAQQKVELSELELAKYLWFDGFVPLEITDSLKAPSFTEIESPTPIESQVIDTLARFAELMSPAVQLSQFKLQTLALEERYKREMVKPDVTVGYKYLGSPENETLGGIDQNYTLEAGIKYPLFTRKERADLRMNQLDQKAQEAKILEKQRNQTLSIYQSYTKHTTTFQQLGQMNEMVRGYERMVDGERQKFEMGESSLFLINTRELYLISAEVKQAQLHYKFAMTQVEIFYKSGVLEGIYE